MDAVEHQNKVYWLDCIPFFSFSDDQLELFYQSQTEKYPQIKLQYDVDTRQTVTIHGNSLS
jgi:hypothetical protein